jgi:hypothetical protein
VSFLISRACTPEPELLPRDLVAWTASRKPPVFGAAMCAGRERAIVNRMHTQITQNKITGYLSLYSAAIAWMPKSLIDTRQWMRSSSGG